VRRRQRLSWYKFVTNLEHETYRTQPKVYKILKQISKDEKETARIQGNIDENVFLRYYEKLWNTTNINELQLEYNLPDYSHVFITLDELEKVLKLTKNGKTPGQDNINSDLYKYAPEEFKLRLLKFLNNIYIGRPRRRWADNIRMDLQEIGGGCGDWMELAQDRDGWRTLVGTVRNLRVP
jgi:hypothetical protein